MSHQVTLFVVFWYTDNGLDEFYATWVAHNPGSVSSGTGDARHSMSNSARRMKARVGKLWPMGPITRRASMMGRTVGMCVAERSITIYGATKAAWGLVVDSCYLVHRVRLCERST